MALEARLVLAFEEGRQTGRAVGGVPRVPSAGFERLRTHRGYRGCEHTPRSKQFEGRAKGVRRAYEGVIFCPLDTR
jgi:hypothetical protein